MGAGSCDSVCEDRQHRLCLEGIGTDVYLQSMSGVRGVCILLDVARLICLWINVMNVLKRF